METSCSGRASSRGVHGPVAAVPCAQHAASARGIDSVRMGGCMDTHERAPGRHRSHDGSGSGDKPRRHRCRHAATAASLLLLAAAACLLSLPIAAIASPKVLSKDPGQRPTAQQALTHARTRPPPTDWPTHHRPASHATQVFIYDLAKWNDAEKHGDVTDSEYGLDQLFGQVLRSSSGYVTDDPAAADFFYVGAPVVPLRHPG
jgi:hypothetical protein